MEKFTSSDTDDHSLCAKLLIPALRYIRAEALGGENFDLLARRPFSPLHLAMPGQAHVLQ
jgi:hypothetical protein